MSKPRFRKAKGKAMKKNCYRFCWWSGKKLKLVAGVLSDQWCPCNISAVSLLKLLCLKEALGKVIVMLRSHAQMMSILHCFSLSLWFCLFACVGRGWYVIRWLLSSLQSLIQNQLTPGKTVFWHWTGDNQHVNVMSPVAH